MAVDGTNHPALGTAVRCFNKHSFKYGWYLNEAFRCHKKKWANLCSKFPKATNKQYTIAVTDNWWCVSRHGPSAHAHKAKAHCYQWHLLFHTQAIISERHISHNPTKHQKYCSLLMPWAPVCTEHQRLLCYRPKAMFSPHESSGEHMSSNGYYNEVSLFSSLFVLTKASNGKWL